MSKNAVWNIHPVKNEIILTLVRHKGEMIDSDLLRNLKTVYKDVTRKSLYKILFQLEVEMIIEVTRMRKNVNRIALRKKAPINSSLLKTIR